MKTYFGDIHTHTNYSDGSQDPPFTMARARNSVDFYAFSDHAQLPDTPSWGPDLFHGWREIVQPLHDQWADIQKLIRDNHEPGKFVTFLGYEWSSMQYGDHNVYYLRDDEPIRYARTLPELYAKLEGVPALLIPHHTGYPPHQRGYDWAGFDPRREPMVEIYSHHGLSEDHQGPRPFNGPGMGPRCAAGSIRRALNLGHVFGIMASSDDHQGYPGSHNMGLIAVRANELTRDSLWDAFWNRRTYAVTGDRILLDYRLNGEPVGSLLRIPAGEPRRLAIDVEGWDCLQSVEIVKNGDAVKTWTDFALLDAGSDYSFRVALEWGYHGGTVRDWNITAAIDHGNITGANHHFGMPGNDCWQIDGSNRLTISSSTNGYTGGQGNNGRTYGALKHIDLAVDGSTGTRIDILLDDQLVLTADIGQLLKGDRVCLPFGPYSGAVHLIGATPRMRCAATLEWEDKPVGPDRDYYYVRVTQRNGQMAWSTPIWTSAA